MKISRYTQLTSEVAELEHLLEDLSDQDWIRRASLSGRLLQVKAELENTEPEPEPKVARLTFRGDPVRGSEAISADFASKVTNFFNDAVTSIAAGLNDRLGHMGRIPDKRGNQLYITGTALGSFGFEFELPSPDSMDSENVATTEDALERLLTIFEKSAAGDDDELSDVVDEIHPRAAAKVSEMLDFMVKEKAYCGLVSGSEKFQFPSFQTLETASKNLKSDRIKKGDKEFIGEFKGSLPQSREFEFKSEGESHSWKGRIGSEIDDPEKLRPYLYRRVNVTLKFVQVGHAKPRYTLAAFEDIKEKSNSEDL